jgi:hypothetical protein
MLGYGLSGGVFGGGNSQSRAAGNPFVGNMTSGFMLPGNAPSSADNGQNATKSPFMNDDFDLGTTDFSGPWRQQAQALNKLRKKPKVSTAPVVKPPPIMPGPLASDMQSTPMAQSSFSNPFMYF